LPKAHACAREDWFLRVELNLLDDENVVRRGPDNAHNSVASLHSGRSN
jgi:hypothetical protein